LIDQKHKILTKRNEHFNILGSS